MIELTQGTDFFHGLKKYFGSTHCTTALYSSWVFFLTQKTASFHCELLFSLNRLKKLLLPPYWKHFFLSFLSFSYTVCRCTFKKFLKKVLPKMGKKIIASTISKGFWRFSHKRGNVFLQICWEMLVAYLLSFSLTTFRYSHQGAPSVSPQLTLITQIWVNQTHKSLGLL